jgi:large subunit ribosomal protein L9
VAKARARTIEGMELVIQANAGPEGKLFGSVGPIDIAEAFERVQVEVERSEIRMAEGPIQELGEFAVGVHLHPEVDVEITVRVVEAE